MASDDLFHHNAALDIYSSVVGERSNHAGSGAHRKAVMREVLQVLAGRETMWNWNAGVDASKTTARTSHNERRLVRSGFRPSRWAWTRA